MKGETMGELNLLLTEEEWSELLRLLTQSVKGIQVEVHRTDALNYKAMLQHEESVLAQLLEKVQALGPRQGPDGALVLAGRPAV